MEQEPVGIWPGLHSVCALGVSGIHRRDVGDLFDFLHVQVSLAFVELLRTGFVQPSLVNIVSIDEVRDETRTNNATDQKRTKTRGGS